MIPKNVPFLALKKESLRSTEKRKTKKSAPRLSWSGSSASQGEKRCPSPRVSVSVHPPLSTTDTPIRTLEGLMRPDPRPATQKKCAKEAPYKLVKLSNKVWSTSLKNISFHLDHPELSEAIMLEPGATCMGKNAPQIRPTSWSSSCQFQCQQRVQECDVCKKLQMLRTLTCLFTSRGLHSPHCLYWSEIFSPLCLCLLSWICLCQVRSSLEVDLCSKSMQGHVRLRTSLPKTKGTGASELAMKWGIEARCGDALFGEDLGLPK